MNLKINTCYNNVYNPLKTDYILTVVAHYDQIIMKEKFHITTFLLLSLLTLHGQESLPYESKIADLGEIQMEYMDFGGTGPTLVWVQDYHNRFDYPIKYQRNNPFFKALSEEFHVLAPLRPGYGKSTNIEWGYDVATQSKFLLRFMDFLGIEKAVLYGRSIANQDMTWIAEHHPERVQGLIFDGNPRLTVECANLQVLEFVENNIAFMTEFKDKEKMKRIGLSRAFWRPDFLNNSKKRIKIPALLFAHPQRNLESPNLFFVSPELLKARTNEDPPPGRAEEHQYFQELLKDTIRYKQLQKTLIECNPPEKINSSMKRAFGPYLTIVWEGNEEMGFEANKLWELENILAFKEKLID